MDLPSKLYHYSEKQIKKLKPDFYDTNGKNWLTFHKPQGLWFSVEDYEDDQNWKTWCESEEFRLENLKCKYKVKVKNTAKIIHLLTPKQIIDFGIKYIGNDQSDFNKHCLKSGLTPHLYTYLILWKEVMKDYDGIIIAPYQWSCRLLPETTWYYGWDCSSGCIWNMNAIEEITLQKDDLCLQNVAQQAVGALHADG